ncbi:MAG: membrane lipoprotein lipid attachment site-containing protein [Oscillospiraceae bacterium]|nr:membrane lipoprotein lipid attachment site-containing protein [Oscillospiraceae bacterium]
MKRIILPLLAAVLLTGCVRRQSTNPTVEPIYDVPTLPTFLQEETPQQKLTAAIKKCARPFEMTYGTRWQEESLTTIQVDAATDLTDAKALFLNERFIETFCDLGVIAIPSNTGAYSYQLTRLTLEETCLLITGRAPTEEELAQAAAYESIEGYATIETDPEGRFTSLTVELDLHAAQTTTYQRLLTISYP